MQTCAWYCNLGWFRLLAIVSASVLLVLIAVVVARSWKEDLERHTRVRLTHVCSSGRHELLGITEVLGCLVEASFERRIRAWNDPPGTITVSAYSLKNLVPLWSVRLVGKELLAWPSSVSPNGSYLAAKLITHKGPLLEDPYYAHIVFFDLKQKKVAWIWPEKPVALDPHDWDSNFSAVYFATDQDAYWSTREDNKTVIYKINVPGRKAEPFLIEGEARAKPLGGSFYLHGYSPATQELLAWSGKALYAIAVGAERRCRVLLEEPHIGSPQVHVSANGSTIGVLGKNVMIILHGAPDFKLHAKLDHSKLPAVGGSFGRTLAFSPDGQYIALSYYSGDMFPVRFVILSLSGDPLLEFDTAPLGHYCPLVIWFDQGRKIAAGVGHHSWCIWELQGLK